MTAPEFVRAFALDDLRGGKAMRSVEATAEERAALARRFELIALDSLSAELKIVEDGAEIRVSGVIRASGAQRCVATLDAAPFALDAPLDERFTTQPETVDAQTEDFDLSALDAPEPIDGDAIDLGELAAQALALALDPHPRAPHAPEDASYAEPSPYVVSPFAKLAALKR